MGYTDRREVKQFQYTAWPDHGVPEHPAPFLQFLRRIVAMNTPDAGPVITHCRYKLIINFYIHRNLMIISNTSIESFSSMQILTFIALVLVEQGPLLLSIQCLKE